MITFEPTIDMELIKSIATNMAIWKNTYGQFLTLEEFAPNKDVNWILIKEDNIPIGYLETRFTTNVTLEAHIALLPEHRGQKARTIIVDFCKHIKNTTKYKKIITDVPLNCMHNQKLMKDLKWDLFGYSKHAIIYNGRLTDLLFFEFDLKRL